MSQELKDRTKAFAIRVLKMCKVIKGDFIDDIIIKQMARSATSVGANYRSALRARSTPDFISKITIAEEEADETCFWLELLVAMELLPLNKLYPLLKEAQEITAILTASGKTARQKTIINK